MVIDFKLVGRNTYNSRPNFNSHIIMVQTIISSNNIYTDNSVFFLNFLLNFSIKLNEKV